MSPRIAVIGDGAMGTLSAIMLAENGCQVRLYSAFPETAGKMSSQRENSRFLPGLKLPDNIEVTCDPRTAVQDVELAVAAVPTQFVRWWWGGLKPFVSADLPICSVAKGIENKTLLRPSQIILDVLDGSVDSSRPVAVLSGPCVVPEVARHLPATVTAASNDLSLAARVQQLYNRPYFRVYTNNDLVGTELAGASKNVIAIAAGILDGISAGDNAKAALVTRGLAEISRLGLAAGAKAETFAGLAGVGDLVTTCISPVGRNRSFGEAIGKGANAQEYLAAIAPIVVEGVATTASLVQLAERLGVEMPLTFGVHSVLFDGRKPADAITHLMSRPLKSER